MSIEVRAIAQAAVVLEGPAGVGRRLASLDGVEVLRLSLVPGAELPAHRVPDKAWFLVLSGAGRLTVDEESAELGEGDSTLVPAGATRGWLNRRQQPLELLVLRGV